MKTKPIPHQYYDIHDLVRYFNFSNTRDLLFSDEYPANGELISFYEGFDDDCIRDKKDIQVFANRKKVFETFGDVEVKVWW